MSVLDRLEALLAQALADVRAAAVCDDHKDDECPCLEWAPEAHAGLARLEGAVPALTACARELERHRCARHIDGAAEGLLYCRACDALARLAEGEQS